jgi:hypothetical protein
MPLKPRRKIPRSRFCAEEGLRASSCDRRGPQDGREVPRGHQEYRSASGDAGRSEEQIAAVIAASRGAGAARRTCSSAWRPSRPAIEQYLAEGLGLTKDLSSAA